MQNQVMHESIMELQKKVNMVKHVWVSAFVNLKYSVGDDLQN